jgi:hypothetical protein
MSTSPNILLSFTFWPGHALRQHRFRVNLLDNASRNSEQASGWEKDSKQSSGQTKSLEQACQEGQVNVDGVAVEDGKVQDLSAVEDGDAKVLALVDELLAIVDGTTGSSRAATADDDGVAVQGRDVQELEICQLRS